MSDNKSNVKLKFVSSWKISWSGGFIFVKISGANKSKKRFFYWKKTWHIIFEAGLALGRHPEKTLLVQAGKIRETSDIGGKHIVKLNNEHSKETMLPNRLRKIDAA